jgi:thioesterase domain-containing protein/acyl carrier protein
VTLVNWAGEVFSEEELSGVLASTSICFDLSVFELMVPLSWGGKVVLADNALGLPELRVAEEVRLINTVPSAIKELVGGPGIPDSVETVNLAGEPLRNDLTQQIYERGKVRRVLNLYGPTEDTTYSTWTVVSRGVSEEPTLGQPIANTAVFILDEEMMPAPVGVYGDIYISGEGLARCYLNRPEITAEKFLPNPFANGMGERLYSTGDIGRYTRDGNIEYKGRRDYQVKIRGYRIELGEIERVLEQRELIREAVVVVREDRPGDKRLVAYVTVEGETDKEEEPKRLRKYLKEKLPDYMTPSAIMALDKMPLTPNGKLDRKALPAPWQERDEGAAAYVAPRDVFELQLVKIWEGVLGRRPISVKDNFFDLGGHSLLAVSLMARIRSETGRELPLSVLFQGGTIERLASNLRQSPSSSWSCLVELQTSGSKPPLFFVHPAGGNVICFVDLALSVGPDQPFYGLQAVGLYGEQSPFTRIEDAASHYIEAVRSVQPEGPYFLGGWSLGGYIAYEMAQQLWAQGQKVGQLLLLDNAAQPATEKHLEEDEEDIAEGDDAVPLMNLFAEFLPISREDMERDLNQFQGDARIDYVLKKIISANLVPPDVDIAQARSYLKMHRAYVRAMNKYVTQVYPGSVTLFRTAKPPVIPDTETIEDSTMGWGALAAGGVRVIDVPGDHETMVRKPHVETLAMRINACLDADDRA